MPRRRRPRPPTRSLGGVTSHFTREGAPKTNYRTQKEAEESARVAWTIHGVELSSYRCDFCHHWHIGKRFRDD
jgi:hypothetical protein